MIQLILDPQAKRQLLVFEGDCVTIGNARSSTADVRLEDPAVQDIHLKLIRQEDRYVLLNIANDPFVSLNGVPFGKKTLKNGDLIQLSNHSIQVVIPEVKPVTLTEEDFPVASDIDELLQQVEELESKKVTPSFPKELPAPTAPLAIAGKEEVKQIENKTLEEKPAPAKEKLQPKRLDKCEPMGKVWSGKKAKEASISPNWRQLAKIFVWVALLGAIVCSAIYWKTQGTNSQEEKKVAAGIADISMALMYAQFNHLSPDNQNLLDPDFLRSNLGCVLSPNLHTQVQIDTEGHFSEHPYILRAYADGNTKRFLVIAQPLPHIFQWIFSKKTFVIDSASMEIRKISDLKSLNRLLATPAPLEGRNGAEIAKIVQQGELISLPALAGNKNHWGFVPPKSLAWMRPGAENYIYNAPRYYPFGEAILRDVIAHFHNEGTGKDIVKLQEQISDFAQLQEVLLYSSQGLEVAIEGERALSAISPQHRFLIGYLQFNSVGYVTKSHMLVNEKAQQVSFEPTENDSLAAPFGTSYEAKETFLQHPLALRVHAIATSREKELKPLAAQMVELIDSQSSGWISDFYEQIDLLLKTYRERDVASQAAMIQELARLYQEYSEMPLEQFLAFVEESHLTEFVADALQDHRVRLGDRSLSEATARDLISAVDLAVDLNDLDERVQQAISALNLEYFPHPQQLVLLQKQLNEVVVEKLIHLFLSPQSPYAHQKVGDRDRTLLIRILKSAWITNPHEFDYFLGEFDHLESSSQR